MIVLDYIINAYEGKQNPLSLLIRDSISINGSNPFIVSSSGSVSYSQLGLLCERYRSVFDMTEGSNCLIVGGNNASTALAIIVTLYCGSNVFLVEKGSDECCSQGFLTNVAVDYRIEATDYFDATSPAICINKLSRPARSQIAIPNHCLAMSTSGTTSAKSKGVLLTQGSIYSNLIGILSKQVFQPGVSHVNIIPLTHAFGFMADLIIPFALGCSVFYPCDIVEYFSVIAEQHPRHLNIPPAITELFVKRLKAAKSTHSIGIDNARLLCAGASMKDWVVKSLRSYGKTCFVGYGLTECSPCVALTSTEEIGDGTIGSPLPNLEVRIGRDNSELLVRGSCLFSGYITEEGIERGKVDNEGWLHTGDEALQDDRHRLYILGRIDDVAVFSDGTKIQARTIERLIEAESVVDSCLAKKHPERDTWVISYYAENNVDEEHIFSIIREAVTAIDPNHKLEAVTKVDEPFATTSALGKTRRNV